MQAQRRLKQLASMVRNVEGDPVHIRPVVLFGLEFWEVYVFNTLSSQWASLAFAERKAAELRKNLHI